MLLAVLWPIHAVPSTDTVDPKGPPDSVSVVTAKLGAPIPGAGAIGPVRSQLQTASTHSPTAIRLNSFIAVPSLSLSGNRINAYDDKSEGLRRCTASLQRSQKY